jgi:hypothetical protein
LEGKTLSCRRLEKGKWKKMGVGRVGVAGESLEDAVGEGGYGREKKGHGTETKKRGEEGKEIKKRGGASKWERFGWPGSGVGFGRRRRRR